jgi:hypothetical protein
MELVVEVTVCLTAVVLFVLGIFRPLMKWPKWLAWAGLATAALAAASELLWPDPIVGGHPDKTALVVVVVVFWSSPAIGYGCGRLLRWIFIGPAVRRY